jgi:hypothetical protein
MEYLAVLVTDYILNILIPKLKKEITGITSRGMDVSKAWSFLMKFKVSGLNHIQISKHNQ